MELEDLRWGCSLYAQLTSYDDSYARFRACVGQAMDPVRTEHHACLFPWLNSWGCRQFALDHHRVAATSLVRWAATWYAKLPAADVLITDLTPGGIRTCAEAYDDLRQATASYKVRGGRSLTITYGPTGAAKTLFALRPNAIPPWDDPIRGALGANGDLGSFRTYLTHVASQLQALASSEGVEVAALPVLVGRPSSSPPKLIDEYNWITYTRGMTGPT